MKQRLPMSAPDRLLGICVVSIILALVTLAVIAFQLAGDRTTCTNAGLTWQWLPVPACVWDGTAVAR